MLLTGLWHGAGLQFLIFGLLHGIYLTANQAWRHFRQRRKGVVPEPPTGLMTMAMRIGVYLQVSLALIFFRASSLHSAFAMLGDLMGRNGGGHIGHLLDAAFGFALFPVVWFMPNTQQILGEEPIGAAAPSAILPNLRWSPTLGWGIVMAVLFFAVLANIGSPAPFLYFQF
jgi:hypothetical protein